MIWFTSTLAGFVAAIVTIVAIVVATTTWHMDAGAGSGGVGVVSFGLSEMLLLPAALAFALGFLWMFRRQRRRLAR
jgi:hypothetical protein